MSRLSIVTVLVVVLSLGCRSPIGVRETGLSPVDATPTASVFDGRGPSPATLEVLERLGWLDDFHRRPEQVIAELETANLELRSRETEVAIAELHYHRGLRRRDRGHYLASAVHAYLYLFGDEFSEEPNPYSPRFQLARELYNRALAQVLLTETGEVRVVDTDLETPRGTITMRAAGGEPTSIPETYSTFLPADAFEVRGLRERNRDHGLGVPLIAVQAREGARLSQVDHIDRENRLPATALMRLEGGLEDFLAGRLEATLEVHLATDAPSVRIGERWVPLQADVTAPFAHALEGSRLWSFRLRGFRNGETKDVPAGVYQMEPYRPGKIPLLLIHGTASSPAAWAQLINGLFVDRRLRARYQVWLAAYNSGNPISYSAAVIREQMIELQQEFDPEGVDEALSKMVVVGHSQGGLIARLLISDSGQRIWEGLVDQPFETYSMEPEAREVLARMLFFEPLPFVRRAVFIATPHRGSFVADWQLGKLTTHLVELAPSLTAMESEDGDGQGPEGVLRDISTSVDEMDPDSRFLRVLAELPFGDGIRLHSIIAVRAGSGPIEEGNDGVVSYSSAHLEGVDSEFVVRHRHACLAETGTIAELRRVLMLEDLERR